MNGEDGGIAVRGVAGEGHKVFAEGLVVVDAVAGICGVVDAVCAVPAGALVDGVDEGL